jgi:acyl-CoA synthetase (AMP-forming)/AMP-acid ligase II
MFLGYDGDRSATATALRGGFFRTGDLGRVEAGGRVTLVGRLKDVIVRGGNNVSAREVERVLEAHPDVAEATVVGVPHPDLGEEVAAAIVLRRGSGRGERVIADLDRRCATLLSAYKRPRRWEVLDRLPRTPSGKVRKDEVRSLIRDVG